MKLTKQNKIFLGVTAGGAAILIIVMIAMASGKTPPPPESEYAHTGDGDPTPGIVISVPTSDPDGAEAEDPAASKPEEDSGLHIGVGEPPALPGNAEPKEITLNKNELTVTKGNTYKFRVSFAPEDAARELKWVSDNKGIAAVSDDGIITGIAAGTAIVTAKTPNGHAAQCAVTVKNLNVGGIEHD